VTSIQLGDARTFGRRAAIVRGVRLAVAAMAVGAAVAFLVASFRDRAAVPSLLPSSSSGIVVLDLSASISSDTYERIDATLDRLVHSNGAYGLILFSDIAYQALPPQTPSTELRPFQRFFEIPEQKSPGALPRTPRSPWTEAFSSGTRISTGLSLALDVIRGNRLVRPAVLLVSDLDDDDGDIGRLSQVAIAYRRAGIPLHVVGLNASPEDAAFIRRFVTGNGSFTEAALPSERGGDLSGRVDPLLAGFAVVLALGLAAYLLLSEPLRWRAT
jgi:hypothetical protein